MIKICHVITDYNVGGAGRWLINYLSHADYNQFKIFIVVPSKSDLKPLLKDFDVTLVSVEDMKEKSFDGNMIHYLVKLFKINEIQVVHTHASLTARLAGKIANVPCMINSKHCLDSTPQKGFKVWVKSKLNNYLSDRIIAISKAVENQLINQGVNKNKVSLIYNGIESIPILNKDETLKYKTSLGIPEEGILIGIFARLEPIKNHEMLLEAFNQLYIENKLLPVYLLVVGDGSLSEHLRTKAKQLEAVHRIVFTGHISQVEKAMNSIDVNVICSKEEALSLSLIEGMMLKKVNVGTDVGGIPEVITDGKTGYIVPSNDFSSLKDKLTSLVIDEILRDKMGQLGYEKALDKFKASKMACKIEKTYVEVLEEKNGKVK